ncbi:uncharacterized protein LOC126657281 [Mercurialis annua]|uniref:uncharacterized protein LOC126657281 n=1 Tax=Mercurialis annua TaxID=3986 RepID=UPI00215EF537|nr:uncharacterized protein LOC126657281 [Mercurialis annua]
MAETETRGIRTIKSSGKTLNLTEEEDDEIILQDPLDVEAKVRTLYCLSGKLLTTKTINVEAMRRTFNSIWKLNKGFGLKQWPNNIFVFQFYSTRDKDRVIMGSPWTFDNNLLVLKDVDGILNSSLISDVDVTASPADMIFNIVPFWIRILNVPIGRMTKGMANILGQKLGPIIDIDEERLGGWSRFMRIRIEININNPLKRGIMIRDVIAKNATPASIQNVIVANKVVSTETTD